MKLVDFCSIPQVAREIDGSKLWMKLLSRSKQHQTSYFGFFTKAAKMSEPSTWANWTDWNLHKFIHHFFDVFFWRQIVRSSAEPVKALNGAWKAFNSKCSGQFQEVQLEQRLNTSVSEWLRLQALPPALNWKQSPLGNVQSRLLPVDRKWL